MPQIDLVRYVDEAKNDAAHAFSFLKDSGTLSASLIFNIAHRVPEHDKLLSVRFPPPWSKTKEITVSISDFADHKDSVLNEKRLHADTFIHAHTPHLAAWSLAQKPFPILYVAAQRHLLAREIPNHLERTRGALEILRERLDRHPELAPPPAILESNGGANFWGKGHPEDRRARSPHRGGGAVPGDRRTDRRGEGLHTRGSRAAVGPHRPPREGQRVYGLTPNTHRPGRARAESTRTPREPLEKRGAVVSQKRKRQLSLSVFVQQYGTHGLAWRRPQIKAGGNPSFEEWASIVRTLERGKFDFAFFADFVGQGGPRVLGNSGWAQGGHFEPTALVAALAGATRHIGLVATVITNCQRAVQTWPAGWPLIDHLSGGRVGWNIVSSLAEGAAQTFGVNDGLDHDQRYERAAEFVDLTKKLWDSWDDGAFDHPDKEKGIFADGKSAHPVHHRGRHFKADALLDIARPMQALSVFFQAGNSDSGKDFAGAQYAEASSTPPPRRWKRPQAFYRDVEGPPAGQVRARTRRPVAR